MAERLTGAGGKPIGLSVAGDRALCSIGRKCIKKDGHAGACWPVDVTPAAEGRDQKEDAS